MVTDPTHINRAFVQLPDVRVLGVENPEVGLFLVHLEPERYSGLSAVRCRRHREGPRPRCAGESHGFRATHETGLAQASTAL